jgi:predicted transcriptional regulator
MQRTTIVLPEDLRARVRRLAAERGVSMATIIREAIEQKMNEKRPKPKSLGIAESGHSDTSELSIGMRPEPRSWR